MKKIASILLLVVTLTCTLRAQEDTISKWIPTYVKAHDFTGNILIMQQGKNIYEHSFGIANRAFNVPFTSNTLFKVASITKLFTATLVLQLVEQGKIDLNKTIGDYLPDYRGEGARKVTIHQLLNHTSGIGNIDTAVTSLESALKYGLLPYQIFHSQDDMVSLFCSKPLVSTPGTVFSYNNAEYIILGKIISRLYGKSYEEVLKQQILQPLNLTHTGVLKQYLILPGLASTYFFRDDVHQLANDLPVYPENWYAAGSMYSCTEDLAAFANALYEGKLLKQASLALLEKPGLDNYGYSVWVEQRKFGEHVYHTFKRPGSIMGAQGCLFRVQENNMTIILLSNTTQASTDDFIEQLSVRLLH